MISARGLAVGALLALWCARPAAAANLDVTAAYDEKALSYTNLNLDSSNPNDHSFIEDNARMGIAVRNIFLETKGAQDTTMDVGILFHAINIAGSSSTATSAPFAQAANNYPNVNFTPFLENAYLRVHNLWGEPLEATFGRQSFKLGSGLLLDDDGAGFTGVTMTGELPWGGSKLEGFIFNDHDLNAPAETPNQEEFFGFSFSLPTDGTWELNELVEKDHANTMDFNCSFLDPNTGLPTTGCAISRATKSFTSARYQISYGPMIFDGEAALERGSAAEAPQADEGGFTVEAPNHITYEGDAEVVRAKWKQSLYHTGEGIARLSLAHGSGSRDNGTTDNAFFPDHGHRFDGIERDGFGEFFGATPYDAYGGNYASTTTANGLQNGSSGIFIVGAGYTPPSYRNWTLDVDYFLFQADKVATGLSRTLGTEWDFHLRYPIADHFQIKFLAALFNSGAASSYGGKARKYGFEASGRF